MRYACAVSGKDSAKTALVVRELYPELDVEYFCNTTKAELPEFNDWLDNKLAPRLDRPIIRIEADLQDIIERHGILPSSRIRFCTREAKIIPTEKYFAGDEVTIFYGLRADEPERSGYVAQGKKKSKVKIVPRYPLREQGLGLMDVWNSLDAEDLLPPQFFWQALYDRVCSLIGPELTPMLAQLPRPAFSILFAWRSRPNCFYCFFQRQYEFIGLHEHHPDLFWQAVELEETTGADSYTFQQGHTLRSLLDKRDLIITTRARQIVKTLGTMWQSSMVDMSADMLTGTSCGLVCGK